MEVGVRNRQTYVGTSNLAAIHIQAQQRSIGIGIGHNKSEEDNNKLEEAEE